MMFFSIIDNCFYLKPSDTIMNAGYGINMYRKVYTLVNFLLLDKNHLDKSLIYNSFSLVIPNQFLIKWSH